MTMIILASTCVLKLSVPNPHPTVKTATGISALSIYTQSVILSVRSRALIDCSKSSTMGGCKKSERAITWMNETLRYRYAAFPSQSVPAGGRCKTLISRSKLRSVTKASQRSSQASGDLARKRGHLQRGYQWEQQPGGRDQ